jgi:hypothetical protein
MRALLVKYLHLFAVVLVVQSFGIAFSQASEPLLVDGEIAEVRGRLFIAKGEDNNERKVTYLAIRLDMPVTVADKVQTVTNVRVLKLLPSDPKQKHLRSFRGKQVQVKGKVLYRWYGPSSGPNSTMLVVQEMTVVHESGNQRRAQ